MENKDLKKHIVRGSMNKKISLIIDHLDELHLIMSQVSLLKDLSVDQLHSNINLFIDMVGESIDEIYKLQEEEIERVFNDQKR